MTESAHSRLLLQADEKKAKKLALDISLYAVLLAPEPGDWYRALQIVQDEILKVFEDERFAGRLDRRMDND